MVSFTNGLALNTNSTMCENNKLLDSEMVQGVYTRNKCN